MEGESIRVRFPDGTELRVARGTTLEALARFRGEEGILAAMVDGQPRDLNSPLVRDAEVRFLRFEDPEGRQIYWHSSAHLLAQAVKELFPGAKLAIGPPIEDGFYYDVDVGRSLTPEDLERIEAKMRELAARDQRIERVELPREEAIRLYQELGEKYKLELLQEIPDERISFYRQDGFLDMCRGPHLPRTGLIRAIKVLGTSGAYWRGDERREQLVRIYGITFPAEEQLRAFLDRLEEARRRDHRRLGRELELFSIEEEVGPGLVLWHPRGAVIRRTIEEFLRAQLDARGYRWVYTPHVAREALWEQSGHLSWYRENMFSGIEVEGQRYLVKPMNCPFHIMIYRSKTRSYRDLPLRLAEFGTVYRYERSGVLHGLLRVRMITQDDAHIFCRPDQIESEIADLLDLAFSVHEAFGFERYEVMLSVRDPRTPEKYAGRPEVWDHAEAALEQALIRRNVAYTRAPGEANFYGPKIDVYFFDALGRKWQLTTIQLDFTLPERFGLEYTGEDNRPHRPVMIHRAILGSLERFLGILIEHYAGAFPLWLAPEQVRVLPIADRHLPFAQEVAARLRKSGLRVEVDGRNEKVTKKVRDAQVEKVPYMLVVGDREAATGTVAVRHRSAGDLGPLSVEDFTARALQEIAARR
ncbi:MAG: threonine--tRNA ligase [Armatimonadota bacterium]|nr:threonine--tRNA ligase [Armatimonadota bacterium]MDR7443137.1 threonine--tRNA ligase [Armatimonadota bacterium]MDR7569592.1 threonine--tRNA ligase [Armatimonadota bacterium]MDR7614646.1 threonine--tRNA ligase [Armatimonadota bacterium]